jgi:putative acetyltransferase
VNLTIRAAVPGDADALYRLSMAAIRSVTDYYTAAQLDAWAGRRSVEEHRRMIEDHTTFVAHDTTVAGFVSLAGGVVDQLFVDPDHMGRGAARLLLTAVDKVAREAGLTELITHASWRAAPVFAHLGYIQTEIETVALDDQVLTRARMRKSLTH